MKRSFFQAAVSILLYGCTTWTLTIRMEKKLDDNCARMLRAILNKYWKQHPTKQQLYGHLTPMTITIQVRRNMLDPAGDVEMNSLVTYSCGPLHMDEQRQDVQLGPTYNSSVPIQDVALKTYRKRWTTERSGGREPERSVLMAWHDDIYIYIYIYRLTGIMVGVFANGSGDRDSIPSRVIPKTQKMLLDASLLNTQHYTELIKGKWSNLEKEVAPTPTPRYSSCWKGSLRVSLDYGRPTYLLLLVVSFCYIHDIYNLYGVYNKMGQYTV